MKNYVYVPGLVGLRTNAKALLWSFGVRAPEADEAAYDACQVKAVLEIVPDRQVPVPLQLQQKRGSFRYFHVEGETLYYYRKLARVLPLCFAITVKDGVICAKVGKTYLRRVKLKLANIHPIGYVLFDLVTLLLLQKGLLPIFGAAVEMNGHGALIMAPPGMGKTVTSMRLRETYGARLLGEDIVITDGEKLYAVPWTNSYFFRKYDNDLGVRNRAAENADFSPAAVDHIFLLSKGEDGCETVDDAASEIALLQRYGIGYRTSPAVAALCYCNDANSLTEAMKRESELLDAITREAKVFRVRATLPTDYAAQLAEKLK